MGKHEQQPSSITCLMTVKSGAISKDVLMPGQVIYSDQFTARVKGRSLPAHFGIGQREEYTGGTIAKYSLVKEVNGFEDDVLLFYCHWDL